jgi:putative GTP pyrophosphokinase
VAAPDHLRREYDALLPRLARLQDEALFSLSGALEGRVRLHSVTGRIKDFESFRRKVEEKGYEDPFAEVTDLVGVRIVCLYLSDLPLLAQAVEDTLAVHKSEDKVEPEDSAAFGYMSTHFDCTIRAEHSGPRYDTIKDLLFEVQCRTILMDAWASVSHHLGYKGEASIPEPLRRDFHALSGLFYVADKHFELFFNATTKSLVEAEETVATNDLSTVALNRETAAAYFLQRFPNRKHSDPDGVSELVEELVPFGYKTVADLAHDIDRAERAAEMYESEYPPSADEGEDPEDHDARFADVGIVRTAVAIANERYATIKYARHDHHAKYRKHLIEDTTT